MICSDEQLEITQNILKGFQEEYNLKLKELGFKSDGISHAILEGYRSIIKQLADEINEYIKDK
jgi:hypothetical protein